MHYNTEYGDAGNTKPDIIANPKDDPNKGEFIKASVQSDKGVFTIQIGAGGHKQTYSIQSNP